LALDGSEWSVSRPDRFTPGERAPGTRWIGGWVGPQRRSGRGGEEKNSQPPPGIERWNPDRPARSPALYWLSYHGSTEVLLKYDDDDDDDDDDKKAI
jgi:hypothetical protein